LITDTCHSDANRGHAPHSNVQAISSYISLRILHLKPQNSISNVKAICFNGNMQIVRTQPTKYNSRWTHIKIIPSPAAHQDSDGSNINDKMLNVVSALAVSF
jgi:hypothetical protein